MAHTIKIRVGKGGDIINSKLAVYLLVFALSLFAARTGSIENGGIQANSLKASRQTENDVVFTEWDVAAASKGIEKRRDKPYTIMIYMNGSDLESESGAATHNLIQMLESGLDSRNANVIIFTGGTNRWQNDVIPENECVIWEVADGELYELAGVGLRNMGDAGTLSGFISFGVKNFPAERYGLIMWDHGGGSIAGYGHDEKFNNSNLTLLDMDCAFERAGAKLEFLGFDSCLMASVEMAVVASDYARYLVASEDLTPGDGWDYQFLSVLNEDPYIDGAAMGIAITDYFMDYYGPWAEEDLNMSVVDLRHVSGVMNAMGNLMGQCSDSLLTDRVSTFRNLARRRGGTKTFGLGSPRDNESDMVDIGDMAQKLSDMFPREASEVLAALNRSVVYNRNNSDFYLSGLSTYYVFGGKETAGESLAVYAALNMDAEYTGYLHRFYDMLSGRMYRSAGNDEIVDSRLTMWEPVEEGYIMTGIRTDRDTWPRIGGRNVCLYETGAAGDRTTYTAPAAVNGDDCDIVVVVSGSYPDGKILGLRREDGFIIQKGYDPINPGDRLAFYYRRSDNSWYKSQEITVEDGLTLDWAEPGIDAYYSTRLTDIRNNHRFTELRPAY